MIFRFWRIMLAAGLLIGLRAVPAEQAVHAASCGKPLNVVALASRPSPHTMLLAGTRNNGLYQSVDDAA